MVERGIYLKDFVPVVQPLEFLETYPVKGKVRKFYEVEMVYSLPLLEVELCDHVTPITTTETAEIEIDEVYLDDDEIAHLRMIPRDDFAITWMAKPKARPYITTKNVTWQLQTILDDPRTNPAVEHLNLNEIFQFEDTEMWVKAKSNSASLTNARLEFFGYRMLVSEVKEVDIPKGIKPTRVPVEGYGGSSK